MTVSANLARVRERIAAAAERAGRSPDDVLLVVVSKTFPVEAISGALRAGVEVFGENRAQELAAKARALGEDVRWHFIGHLQTNKVRHVVGVAELVHSVDRVSVAQAIAARANSHGIVQDVLVEVNVADDPSKHGVAPAGAPALLDAVGALDGVRLRGVMTMPPWPDRPEDSRPHYRALAQLAASCGCELVSMGMSRDFEVAIEEGATIVRVGEAVFGRRS